MPVKATERVWYAAYGSNLYAERFTRYLVGGSFGPAGSDHPGARDPSPPTRWRLHEVPHRLVFGRQSARWGGGVAFIDPTPGSGSAIVRCWDVTAEQFTDVAAQENGMTPGELAIDIASVVATGFQDVTSRWYGRALHLGDLDGSPVLTFTTATVPAPVAPGPEYLEAVARGLIDTTRRPAADLARYLHGSPGVAPTWQVADIAALIDPADPGDSGDRTEGADRSGHPDR